MSKSITGAEALEFRRLFAAGLPDATFNQTGMATVGFRDPTDTVTRVAQFDSAAQVLQTTDGKLIVVGTSSSTRSATSGFALARFNADGTLDQTFGAGGADENGRVITLLGAGSAQATSAAMLPDGKILVVGSVSISAANSDIAIALYNPDGTLDTTFDGDGLRTLALPAAESPTAVALGPGGTFYVGGGQGPQGNQTFLLARFNGDGSLDTTFDTDGIAQVPNVGGSGQIESLAVGTGGAILAAGFRQTAGTQSDFVVVKYTAAGALDGSFGTGGAFINDFAGTGDSDTALDLAIQTDGRIVVVGQTGNSQPSAAASRFAALRLNADGTLDGSFATGGKFVSTSGRYEELTTVAILPDGRIVAGGTSGDPATPAESQGAFNADFAVIRLTAAGALDPLFGPGGQRNVDLTGGFDSGTSLIVDSVGRIVLAGQAGNASSQGGGADFGLVRLTADTTAARAAVFSSPAVVQGGTAIFNVTLDQPATAPITINFAVNNGTAEAGRDFTLPGVNSITFNIGEQAKTITVQTLTDAGNTAGREFTVTISSPDTNAAVIDTATASATVLGTNQTPPTPVVSINNVGVSEPTNAQTFAQFTVSLDRTSAMPVTVTYTTASGSATSGQDFLATTGQVTIPAGQLTATISVMILADTITEGAESFVVNLSNPINGDLGNDNQGIATVQDAVALLPIIFITGGTFAEPATGSSLATFTVSLNAPAAGNVSATFATSAGTATPGADYVETTGTVGINAGQTSTTITVPLLADVVNEGNETFFGNLSAPIGALLGPTPATAVITPPAGALPVASIGNVVVNEPEAGSANVTFTVTLTSASTTPVTIDFTTVDGTATAGLDYTAVSGTITIPAGQTTATIQVPILADAENEAPETFTVVLSNPNGATLGATTGTATITSITAGIPILSIGTNNTIVEPATGTAELTFNILLDRVSDTDVQVDVTTSDGGAVAGQDYVAKTQRITIPAGSLVATFSVTVLADNISEDVESFFVTLSNPTPNAQLGANSQVAGNILAQPLNLPQVTVDDVTVNESLSGRRTVLFTVSLSAAAASDVTVNFATNGVTATAGTDFLATTGTLTIPAGQTSVTVPVTIIGDVTTEAAETFTLILSNPSSNAQLGAASTGTATINDAGFTTLTFGGKTKATYRDASGANVTLSLTVGSGTAYFATDAGPNPNADTIILNGTTTKSKFTVAAKGGAGSTGVNYIQVNGPLGSIAGAKTLNLTGDLSAGAGGIAKVQVRSVSNSQITIGGGANPTLSLGAVSESSLASASPIKTLTVNAWADSDGNDVASAPTFGNVSSKGAFGATVSATAGNIKKLAVKGAMTGGGATAATAITGFSAASVANAAFDAPVITKFAVKGAVTNSAVRAGTTLTSFTAGTLANSRVLAGVPIALDALPADASPFAPVATASIGKVTVKAFSNSKVIAPNIGSASLGTVASGGGGAIVQGLVTDNLTKSASYTAGGARVSKKATGGPEDNPSGDFTFRIV